MNGRIIWEMVNVTLSWTMKIISSMLVIAALIQKKYINASNQMYFAILILWAMENARTTTMDLNVIMIWAIVVE